MLERIQYINHLGENIDFGNGSVFIRENDLRDFSWEITSKNNRITSFRKGIVSKTIPVLLSCQTEEEGLKMRDNIFEICEKDVLAVKHGKLVIGDYYMKCFVTASKKSNYLRSDRSMELSLQISTDFPYWVKETKTTFNYGIGAEATNMDFNRDFPFDYTSNLMNTQLNNTNFVESDFIIRIFGQCENPSVTIGGHEYSVAVNVGAHEYLTIDSVEKTITLTRSDGRKMNCFNLRNKDSYIFQKIASGLSNVASNTEFKFEVILLEERGEPKWT